MKDTLLRLFTLLLGIGLLVYSGWLLMQGADVSGGAGQMTDMIALIFCLLIAVFLLGVVFMPSIVPTNRWHLLLLGILIVLASGFYLVDNASAHVYLRDVVTLIGVYVIITGPTKMLIPQKIQEQIAEKDVEIIEV